MDPIEDIKNRIDIVDFVSEYVTLTQAGGNFRARCPFHEEKTPSFMVSRQKQIWHCFGGCNEGGDVFRFVMKREGMEFGEALRYLAQKAGVILPARDSRIESQKTRLLDCMAQAACYYQEALRRAPQAEHARQYCAARNITDALIDGFGIGAALPEQSALSNFLLSKKYTARELMQSGLALQKERGYGLIDRFRNRLMIPIHNLHGAVIGFGGRTLEDGAASAKYLNSPQTPLYDKSAVVYNLHRAKQEIRTQDYAIVVEGYMDVFAVTMAGMRNVVASCGTALTQGQLRLLARFTKHLLFSFDMDAAGIAATQRGIECALREGMDVKVIVLPSNPDGTPVAKDPDECIQKDPELWRSCVASAQPFIQFCMERALTPAIHNDAYIKKRAVRAVLQSIRLLSDRIEQHHWIQVLAARVRMSEDLLWEECSQTQRQPQARPPSVATPASHALIARQREELLLAALLKRPSLICFAIPLVKEEMFSAPEHRELYRVLAPLPQAVAETPDMIEEMAGIACTGDYADRLLLLGDKEWGDTSEHDMVKGVETLIHTIRSEFIRSEITRLQEGMHEAEVRGDTTTVSLYAQKFHDLQNM